MVGLSFRPQHRTLGESETFTPCVSLASSMWMFLSLRAEWIQVFKRQWPYQLDYWLALKLDGTPCLAMRQLLSLNGSFQLSTIAPLLLTTLAARKAVSREVQSIIKQPPCRSRYPEIPTVDQFPTRSTNSITYGAFKGNFRTRGRQTMKFP